MKRNTWVVYVYGIQWDDGKGEYDVSRLPKNLKCEISLDEEYDQTEAMSRAMDEITDTYGMLIEGCDQIIASCC